MRKELDDYLVNKYPKIFVDINGNMMDTAMCWGFDHGDGWFWLLDQLCNSIQGYIDSSNKYNSEDKQIAQVVATQVKEKFGTLCFYYSGGDEHIDGMVSLAEDISGSICEYCGTIKDVGVTSGWISVICKDCHEKTDNRKNLEWKSIDEHKIMMKEFENKIIDE